MLDMDAAAPAVAATSAQKVDHISADPGHSAVVYFQTFKILLRILLVN